MNIINQTINIDLQRPKINIIHAKQDDALSRTISICLYSGGTAWHPGEDAKYAVQYRKSDGTCGLYEKLPDNSAAVTASENVLSVNLAPQVFTSHGSVRTSVVMYTDNQVLHTFSFVVEIEASEAPNGVASESYYNMPTLKSLAVAIGNLPDLDTNAKDNLVAAVNELVAKIGDLNELAVEGVESLVEAINKLSEGGGSSSGGLETVSPMDIEGASWLNWFDYENHMASYERDKYISPTNGAVSDYAGYYAFPKIPLKGGKTYTMSGSMRVCVLYNAADNTYISTVCSSPTTSPVTFSVDASYEDVYIRFCHNNTSYIAATFMIVEGASLPDSFVAHKAQVNWLDISDKSVDGSQLVDGTVTGNKLADRSVDGQKMKRKSIDSTSLSEYSGAVNLYNSSLSDASLAHTTTGTNPSTLGDNYFASPKISVQPGATYYVYCILDTPTKASQYQIFTAYDAYEVRDDGAYSKITFESDEASGMNIVYKASENAKYLAFNARTSYINIFVVSTKFYPYCPPYVAEMTRVNNVIQGHYAGGTLVALGDSITRGCSNGETLEDGTVLSNGGQIPVPYVNHAAALLGMYCKNFGVDGATVKTVLSRISSTDYMAGLKAHPDIITVKIGTNDMAQIALGTIDDVYDSAAVTYYSGLKEIARLLSETYPDSAIVFITPLRADESKRTYVKAMQEVANLYDIPCMEMHKVLRYMQKDTNGSYYINDFYNGLHPNQAAHYRMGRALAGFLQTV